MRTGTVYLIGAGPGDPGLFTLRGKELLSACDVVIYDYLANPELLSLARPDAEIIYVGKKGGDHTLPQAEITRLLIETARRGKSVARLKGGDPYMFGRGAEEAEELAAENIDFEVVPGISSALAATAYAGIPLTHRAYASSVMLATGHEDPGKKASAHNWEAMAASNSTLVFFMGMKNLPLIAAKLIAAGLAPQTPAALVQWGTTPHHRSLVASLETLHEKAIEKGFSAPCLIIVGEVARLHDRLAWFEKKPLLGKGIVVTRSREQNSLIAEHLSRLGAKIYEYPAIRVEPCREYAPIHEAIHRIHEYDWIIFTSANSVRFFWEHLDLLGLDSRALGMAKAAAVGPATAEALKVRGIRADYLPPRFVAESLAQGLLSQGMQGKNILIPRASSARTILPDALTAAGARVDAVTVYDTLPEVNGRQDLINHLQAGEIQALSFASSSAVKNFLSVIPPEILRQFPALRFACIGPVTAETLEQHGLPCHIMPEAHTIPALVEAITQNLGTSAP